MCNPGVLCVSLREREEGWRNGKDLFLSTHVLWHLRCCYCFVHMNLFVTVYREFYDEDFMISSVVSKNQKFDLFAFFFLLL